MQYRMPAGMGFDPVLQPRAFFAAPAAATSSMASSSTRTVNANPPDANAAVGPEHIVEVTNFRLPYSARQAKYFMGRQRRPHRG